MALSSSHEAIRCSPSVLHQKSLGVGSIRLKVMLQGEGLNRIPT